MMKEDIVHVISSLLVGGAERFVLDLAKQQQLDGYKVLVINLGQKDDPLIQEALDNAIPILTCPAKRFLTPKHGIYKRLCNARAIHAHNAVSIFRITPYVPFLKGSLVYTRHSEQDLSTITKLAHVFAKYKVKAITFVSEGSKASFYEQFHWPNVKSSIIDNGVFIPEGNYTETHVGENLKIITIGRMVPLKRQSDLLQAVSCMDKATKENIEIHFYGDGELREQLEGLSNKLNLNTFFHGMELNRENIYKQANIVTCMSETEGLSIALLESMAWSIPIVATNVGGNPRCVIDGENGYLYDCGDVIALKEKLMTLIQDREKIIKMGKLGKKRAQNLFSINETAMQYYDCYWN